MAPQRALDCGPGLVSTRGHVWLFRCINLSQYSCLRSILPSSQVHICIILPSWYLYIIDAGDQIVNHIPNCMLLTNKLGLLNSLQAYDRICVSIRGKEPRLRYTDFIPITYKLDDLKEREAFFEEYKGRWPFQNVNI